MNIGTMDTSSMKNYIRKDGENKINSFGSINLDIDSMKNSKITNFSFTLPPLSPSVPGSPTRPNSPNKKSNNVNDNFDNLDKLVNKKLVDNTQ